MTQTIHATIPASLISYSISQGSNQEFVLGILEMKFSLYGSYTHTCIRHFRNNYQQKNDISVNTHLDFLKLQLSKNVEEENF